MVAVRFSIDYHQSDYRASHTVITFESSIEVFRSLDLSWDLRKQFSGGVFRRLGMFTFPFSAVVLNRDGFN